MRGAVVALLLLGACDRVFQLDDLQTTPAGADASGSATDAAPGDGRAGPCTTWGAWGLPQRLGFSAVDFDDSAPTMSADNRRIVFHSNRGGTGAAYEAVWRPGDDSFSAAQPLSIGSYRESPFLSADGMQLWFTAYPTSDPDIHTAKRAGLDDPFGAVSPVPGLAEDTIAERDVAFTADLLTAVFVVGGGNDQEIAISSRTSSASPFDGATYVDVATNTGLYDCCPTISGDGLTLLWEGGSPYGIWQASRPSRALPFGDVVPFTGFDAAAENRSPQFSYDGSRLVYASSTSTDGDLDIYMIERSCAD